MSRISCTLKMQGKDSPWVVLEGETVEELSDLLASVEHGDLLAAVGRCQGLIEHAQGVAAAKFLIGKKLDGKAEQPSVTTTQAADNPWDPQPEAAPEEKAAAPTPPPAVVAPKVNPFAARAAAAPSPTGSPFGQAASDQAPVPGAPEILGQPAKLISGTDERGRFKAFVDPRPVAELEGREETSDPDDPGLADTKRFYKRVR